MTGVIDCEYTIQGSGEPLFLIHGIGGARNLWRFMMPDLEKQFTVISYDLRGHGKSPLPDSEFGLDELVADLERVRERSGFEQGHFAGHSLGGMIGPAYARKYPNRVLSLGILSTAAGRTELDSKNVWAVVKAMEEKGIPQVLETLVDRWFTNEFIAQRPDLVQARIEQVIKTNADIFLNVFRIYAGTEMLPWLNDISVRSLVLTGENDGGCNPRLNQKIADALLDSELVILPHFKHSILTEAADEVSGHLIRFIQHQPI